MIDKWIKIQ